MINRTCEKEPQQRSGSPSQNNRIHRRDSPKLPPDDLCDYFDRKIRKSNIISIMRSEGEKRFKYRSLLICFLCDRLFWIPVTVAVVFDDYTILHSTDHPDCAVDLFSLQHLAVDWLSEFLTALRNDSLHFHFTLRLHRVLDGCLWRYSCAGFSSEILLMNLIQDSHAGF